MKQDKNIDKQVAHYTNLPYTITVERHEEQGGYYSARMLELEGLIMTGNTMEEAIKELEDVKRDWFKTNLELGNKIPEPLEVRGYSGRIVLRLPKSLHKRLIVLAELEGVSLNQLMVSELSKSAAKVAGLPV